MENGMRLGLLGLSLLLIANVAGAKDADRSPIMAFFEYQGCTIGPDSRAAAREAGFSSDEVEALIADSTQAEQVSEEGPWLVLSSEICTIRPPKIQSELSLDDPDVAPHFSERDEFSEFGDIGCFLNPDTLRTDLQKSRGWSEEQAWQGYVHLAAASIIDGEMSFYSADPLRTPPGFILMTGDCADTPDMADIRRSNRFLLENFDMLIRERAARNDCAEPGYPVTGEVSIIAREKKKNEKANAFMFLDPLFVELAAGWIEGATLRDKGKPRPPLCHFGSQQD